jgi:hypothetical protein
MEQETLYNAFLNCLINKEFKTKEDYIAFRGAEFGAKWQQERSYSEDDLEEAFKSGFTNCYNHNNTTFGEWFEQFQKRQL